MLALSLPANANCWGEFDRLGELQFGYVLTFTTRTLPGFGPMFKGVVGPNDQTRYKIVSLRLPENEARGLANAAPTILAIVGDVVVHDSGTKSITVRKVLRTAKEVVDAKAESDLAYPGNCGSSFAEHWIPE